MTILDGQRVIAIEEHYYDAEVSARFEGRDAAIGGPVRAMLDDTGDGRIASMDAAGIDVQVLSHGAPSTQRMDPETAVRVAAGANDRLAALCRASGGRYAGFAALPTPDPMAAADELERAVDKFGLCGAMIHGLTNRTLFIDDRRFWPIFERAARLGVPIYLHPADPHPALLEHYLADYMEAFPGVASAGWGFTVETATAGLRMVLSGVFDAYPETRIILGHLGEGLPFLLWRIDMALNRFGNVGVAFRELFCAHVYVTTSGFFSDPALACCLNEVGADRILFAVDYPFVDNAPGPAWMERLMLNPADKAKILHGNAEALLKL